MKWDEHSLRWLKSRPRIAKARTSVAHVFREWRKYGCPVGRAAALKIYHLRKQKGFWPDLYLNLI